MNKRIISFLLALVMIIGIVINPSFANSNTSTVNKEVKYKTKDIDGRTYKVYNVSDLGLKHPEKLITPKYRLRAAGDPLADWIKVQVYASLVDMTLANDWDIDVYVALRKDDLKIGHAKITGQGVFTFVETENYDKNNPDHQDPDKWQLIVSPSFQYDIRIEYGQQGSFDAENVTIVVAQRANPLYKAVWFTNKNNRPEVTARFNDKNDRDNFVKLNTEDYPENEYKSISAVGGHLYINGKLVEVKDKNKGTLPKDYFLVSDMRGAATWYLEIVQAGERKTKGTIEDGDTKYHFNITGDFKNPFIATMREELKVKFDPNGATFDQAVKTEQPIGHSMKIGETFGDLAAVTVPTKDQISNIPQKDNKDQKFVGWVVDEANKSLDYSNNQNKDKLVDPNGYEVKKNVTFYAVYAPVAQGKVAIQYVDENGNAIKDIYKVQGVDYPKFAEGNKGEDVKKDTIPEPEFIGYERNGEIVVTGKKYTEEGGHTVEVPYKKLDSIIPEKDGNGNDNPKVTEDVKKHYAKVIYQVATDDAEKAKLQLDGADAKSPLVYYVNPVEGIAIKDVANVNAVSKDANLYNVDANDMWTYNPDTITNTNQVISQASDTQGNVVKTEITLTAKVADKTAAKFKDKLDPQDIKVWKGDDIDWKKGVKVKDDAENKKQLVADLEAELAKAKAKVEDLGENGTIAQPGTARTSDEQNLPNGKKGNLKVTFNDGSTLVVNGQMLYVAPHKNDNNTNLPEDAVKVEFKIGDGVTGTAKTEYVKPGTDVKTDAPTVTLKPGFKDAKWYKDKATTEATDADYKVTANAIFTAKATEKGQGKAAVEYHVGDKNITAEIADLKIEGEKYPEKNEFTGPADTAIDTTKIKQPELLGYKIVKNNPITTEPATDAKYTEAGTAKVIFHYEKIDDIIGPVKPSETKPAGYVTVTFKSDDDKHTTPRGQLYLGTEDTKLFTELVYYVNPKANTIDLDNNKLSGKDKEDKAINILVNAKPENKYEVLKKQGGAYDWKLSDSKAIVDGKVTKDLTLTVQYDGLYRQINVYKSAKLGKDLPAEIVPPKAPTDLAKLSAIPDTLKVPDMKSLVVKDGDKVKGVWYFDKWERTVDDKKQEVTFTGYWMYFEPIPKDITVQVGENPDPKDGIENPDDAPKGTDYKFKKPIDTTTPGDKKGTVEVIIPNDKDPKNPTIIEVPITVHVTDLRCMTPAPEINPVYDSDEYITGRGIAGAVIEVRYRDYPILRTKVDTFGEWEVYTPYPLEDEQFVYARQIKEPCDPSVWVSEEIRYDYEYWRKDDKKEEPKKPVEIKKVWTPAELNARDHFSYIKGYGDNTFGPNRTITRAEVAMIFARLSINQSVSGAPQFKDVKAGDWYKTAVDIVARQGVVKGYEDGTFRPNQPITRREFAAIAARYAGNIDTWRTFRDVPSTDWAYTLINRVGGAGWITGYEDNTFRPNNLITRAEVVAIVNRMLNRKADKAYVDNNLMRSKHSFIDNLRSAWYFYDVHEAAVGHSFERQPNGVDEKWNRVNGQAFEIRER